MTDNASRVYGDSVDWRFSDLTFLMDIESADLSSHGHADRSREPWPSLGWNEAAGFYSPGG